MRTMGGAFPEDTISDRCSHCYELYADHVGASHHCVFSPTEFKGMTYAEWLRWLTLPEK